MIRRSSKLVLLTLGVLAGLAILIAGGSAVYLTYNARPRVEALASDTLGVEVRIGGAVHIGVLPSPHLALEDVHLRTQGAEFATAAAVDLGIELPPALQGEIRIHRIAFKRLEVVLERNRDGILNLRSSGQTNGTLPDVSIANVTASKATLRYKDDRTGNGFEARACTLDLTRLRLLAGNRSDWVKNLSFAAQVACAQFQLMGLLASDVQLSVDGSDAVLDFNPVTFRLFEGHASGNVRADFSRAAPLYQVRYQLTAFRIEEFVKTLSPKAVGSGVSDFSANLSLRGTTIDELTRTATGNAALHSNNLTLALGDLDGKFARFESTQNFNLVDAGAFLFAGPIGLGITKGYAYARMLQPTAGSTPIRALVSEWRIEKGVARATDVAMATNRNRLALRGSLDFITARFEDVTVALVDPDGCPEAEQKVHGAFLEPEVAAPSVLKALAGPTRRLIGKAAGLLGHKCVSFYAGAVAPPT